jgi:hypothetical protein
MGIKDANNNELVNFSTTASAVNEITVKNAATTAAPEISATGTDTNIDLKLTPKGSGNLVFDGIEFPNADGTSGQVLQTNGSGVLSFGTVSSYTDSDALDLFNVSGSAPVFACRAWVNFNGTGTVAIRESGNVSSITDNGTGNYTINFTTAMSDANYTVVCGDILNRQISSSRLEGTNTRSTTQCEVLGSVAGGTLIDFVTMEVAIFH